MDPFMGKNLRSDNRATLKQANKAWTDCVASSFLPQWLAGTNLTITEVCTEELSTLKELDSEVYPGGLPFKSSKISASE
jgi:hypothetical protein